jgi:hypothetical protein
MNSFPFDLTDPPDEPPAGCDRVTWQLARQIYRDHIPAGDGVCRARSCRDAYVADWPCAPRRLAEVGLIGSVGVWAGLDVGRLGTRWFANVRPTLRDRG